MCAEKLNLSSHKILQEWPNDTCSKYTELQKQNHEFNMSMLEL